MTPQYVEYKVKKQTNYLVQLIQTTNMNFYNEIFVYFDKLKFLN